MSGANRVNEKGVARHLGEKLKRSGRRTRCARSPAMRSAAFRRSATTRAIATYMDRDLLQYDVIWAAAGTPKAVFAVAPDALREAAGATVIEVK